MNSEDNSPLAKGLTHRQQMALSWEPRQGGDDATLQAVAEANARLLQVLPIFEERRPEHGEEEAERPQDLMRLESKLDMLLELVSDLLREREQRPVHVSVMLSADGMGWTQAGRVPSPCQQIWISLYIDQRLPRALRLPASVISLNTENTQHRVLVRFEHLGESVSEMLEKFIFRHHRREVARMRSQSHSTQR